MRITLLVFLSASTFIVNASNPKESKTRYYRHEVNISIGGVRVRSGWSNDYERSIMNRFGLVVGRYGEGSGAGTGIFCEWDDDPDLTNDNALKAISYYYHFNNRIAVGGLFGGCRVNDGLGYPEVYKRGEIQKTGYTDVKGTSLFLMPSVKWSWQNSKWCSLYMKASAGLHYQNLYLDSETIPRKQTDEYEKNHLSLGYYITPFGWEIGKQKVRWFLELGFGANNNFQTGLTYRFGRY